MENLVIVGSGPAGISASLYTVRSNLSPLVITKEWAVWKRQRRLIIFMEMRKV